MVINEWLFLGLGCSLILIVRSQSVQYASRTRYHHTVVSETTQTITFQAHFFYNTF